MEPRLENAILVFIHGGNEARFDRAYKVDKHAKDEEGRDGQRRSLQMNDVQEAQEAGNLQFGVSFSVGEAL